MLLGTLVVAPLAVGSPARMFLTEDLQAALASVAFLVLAVFLALRIATSGRARHSVTLAWDREGLLLAFACLLVAAVWAAPAPDRAASLRVALVWLSGAALFFALPGIVRDRARLLAVLDGAALVGAVLALVFVTRFASGVSNAEALLVPFSANPNPLAQMLLLPLFAAAALSLEPGDARCRRARACLAAIALGLALTRSRAAWLGAAAGLATAVLAAGGPLAVIAAGRRAAADPTGRRRLAIRLATVLGGTLLLLSSITVLNERRGAPTPLETLATMVDASAGSAGGRLRRWRNALPMVADHWLLGVGPGRWSAVYPAYRHRVVRDAGGEPLATSAWLELAAEAGVPATLALLAFALLLVRSGVRGARAADAGRARAEALLPAALVALLVAAAFHDAFRSRLLLYETWLAAGLIACLPRPARRVPVPRRTARAAGAAVVVLALAIAGADHAHLRASLHHGMLIDLVDYAGPGRRFVPDRLPAPLGPLLRWYFAALDAPDDAALARLGGYTTPRAESLPETVAAREAATGGCADAAPWIARAVAARPSSPRPWLLACACARAEGRPEDALAACESGIARNPHLPELHARRAAALEDLGRPADAERAYATAAEAYRARVGAAFGARSLPAVQADLAGLAESLDAARRLRGVTGRRRSDAELRLCIGRAPLLHSVIAQHDGEIYFSSNRSGDYDLFALDMSDPGALPRPLTRTRAAPFRPRAHPRARRIYFAADDRGDYAYALYELDVASGAVRRLTPRLAGIEAELEPSPDGATLVVKREDGAAADLYLVDTATRAYRRLTEDGGAKRDLAWHPGGSRLVYVAAGERIVEIDVASGRRRSLVEARGATLRAPRFDPGGTRLAYLVEGRDGRSTLALLRLDGGCCDRVPERRGFFLEPTWVGADELAVRENARDEYLLTLVDVAAGSERPIGPRAGVVYPPLALPGERALVYAHAGETAPATLERLDVARDARHTLVALGDVAPDEVLPYRRLTWGSGAEERRAYLVHPEDAARPGPAVVWLHGGGSSFSPRWHLYAQYLARAGFTFAALNYAGSAGVERSGASGPELLAEQVGDVLELRRRLAALPEVDPKRISLVGVSAGTRLLRATLAADAAAFAAAVEYSPLPGRGLGPPSVPTFVFLAENDRYLSPLRGVTPLVWQGLTGAPVRWRLISGEGHDLRSPEATLRRLEETVAFLDALPPRSP